MQHENVLPFRLNNILNDLLKFRFYTQVTVEAKLEHTSTNSRLYKEWTNKYTIPKEADFEKMKYGLDDDGVFRIEAPILPTSEDVAINAPINKNYQMHDDLLMTQKSQRLDTSSCIKHLLLPVIYTLKYKNKSIEFII